MEEQAKQQQTWWQKNKELLMSAFVILGVFLLAFALVVYLFGWDWTGFSGGESKITITTTSKGTTTATELQPARTLWDWLQLLGVLAIPVVVGLGTVWFTTQQATQSDANREKRHQTELEIAEKNREKQQQTELQIASDNQHEADFQAYIDKLSELLLHEKLRESTEDAEVRKIARVRTLTVLSRLDAKRKGSVLQFLQESGLIGKGKRIVDLTGANLHSADLHGADLSEAILVGVDLCYADLFDADLRSANLSGVYMHGAVLNYAKLGGAYLNDADLRSANLSSAKLGEAILSEATLNEANLSCAILHKAILNEADLSGANLSYARLNEANLSDAHLVGADLSNANLEGTTGITTEELEKQAKSLKGTIMPDGSIHP